MEELIKRVPPYSEEAEQACIGSMLTNNKTAISLLMESLVPDDFYDQKHYTIFEAIQKLNAFNKPVDLVTVADYLESDENKLARVGGSAYLASLMDRVPAASSVEYYKTIVKEKSELRTIIMNMYEGIDCVFQNAHKFDYVQEFISKMLLMINERSLPTDDFRSYQEIAIEQLNELQRISKLDKEFVGIPTGFKDIDRILNGLKNQTMILLAARPSMGKTALAFCMAWAIAYIYKIPVGFFSIEMGSREVVNRIFSAISNISLDKFSRPKILTEKDWDELGKIMIDHEPPNIYFDFTSNLSVQKWRRKCRVMVKKFNVGIIITDHFHLMKSEEKHFSNADKYAYISGEVKASAKELDIPQLMLAQLNRGVEERAMKMPQLQDLKETSALEQDADVIMFLHREEYYVERDATLSAEDRKIKLANCAGKATLAVAKQRDGKIGFVNLIYIGERTKFEDMGESIGEMAPRKEPVVDVRLPYKDDKDF